MNLDFDISRASLERAIGMGKDWMKEFLSQRDAKQADDSRKYELNSMAKDATPEMFRRLEAQIRQDVDEYKRSPGSKPVTYQGKPPEISRVWTQFGNGAFGNPVRRNQKGEQ